MADSLVIAGQIELLGAEGGIPSTIPICAGAAFTLAPSYDLGAPQPVVELLAAGLLDGERPIGRRSSNRTISLPIKITAPDRDTLAAAREILLMLVDEDTWQLVWTRDGGPPLVFDCFRAAPSVPLNDILTEQQLVTYVTVSFPALPYGRNDVAEQIVFPVPSQIWDQPTSSLLLDSYGTTTNFLRGDATGFDAGIANWVPGTNCSIARSTAQSHGAPASLALTSAAAGNMDALHCAAASYSTLALRVRPGQTVNVSGWFRTAVSARSANVGALFYDANGTQVGARLAGSNITDSSSAWTQATGALTAPVGAAWAILDPQVVSTGAANEVHYFDDGDIDTGPVQTAVDNHQWFQSNVTPVTGQHSAKWARTAQDYPVYDSYLPAAVDISLRPKATIWLGLATTAAQWGNWHKGTVHVRLDLYDTSGNSISQSGRLYCRAGAIESQPHWQRIGIHLSQVNYGFDYTNVIRYVVSVWNTMDSSVVGLSGTKGQPVLQASAYLATLTATATATNVALTRGIFAEMPGVIGAARAELALQAQPGPSAFSTVTEFTTPGSNAWSAPAGVTQVDKAECWGAGGGGAGKGTGGSGPAIGGGGGGAGEYSAEYKIPVTPLSSYPATVGAAGNGGSSTNPGSSGGDSFWSGQSGPQVRANGGMGGWAGVTWGGGKGGTGSSNAVRYPGGNGHQSNANGDNFGGGGGSSGGTGSAGHSGDNDTRNGGSAVTGGGPGGSGGNWDGTPVANGQPPNKGPGGGGGGGSQKAGASGGNGFNGKVRLTYGATGILPLASLLVHAPGRDAPPTYQPICAVGNGADTPNGATEYLVPPPTGVNLNARFNGTHVVYLIAGTWNTPANSRTLTVQLRQYPYSGGAVASVNLTRTVTPNADITNGYVDMGAVTLPINAIPSGSVSAYFGLTVTSSNTADRFLDCLIMDVTGSLVLMNQAGSSVLQNVWLDPPDTNHPLGLVSGSNTDRDQAYSLTQSIERYSGHPMSVDPQITNRLLVYAAQGVPGFTATYLPRWWMDRAAGR